MSLNPSNILIVSNKPITSEIVYCSFFIKTTVSKNITCAEKFTGIFKLLEKSEYNDEDNDYVTSYRCWVVEEDLESSEYLSTINFREKVDKDLIIQGLWLGLTRRFSKGYKVSCKRDGEFFYLKQTELLSNKLVEV